MERHEALERAIGATETVVRDIEPGQLERATPCSDWNVRELLNHLLGQMWVLEGRLAGAEPRHRADPGALPGEDLVGDDPAGSYKEVAQAVLAASRIEGSDERAGPMSDAYTVDVVVHGWDLAQATGQQMRADEEVAEHLLRFVRMGITEERRAPMFGAEVEAPPDAPATERLVAFLGRAPS